MGFSLQSFAYGYTFIQLLLKTTNFRELSNTWGYRQLPFTFLPFLKTELWTKLTVKIKNEKHAGYRTETENHYRMHQIYFGLLNNNVFLQVFLQLTSKYNNTGNGPHAENSLKYIWAKEQYFCIPVNKLTCMSPGISSILDSNSLGKTAFLTCSSWAAAPTGLSFAISLAQHQRTVCNFKLHQINPTNALCSYSWFPKRIPESRYMKKKNKQSPS